MVLILNREQYEHDRSCASESVGRTQGFMKWSLTTVQEQQNSNTSKLGNKKIRSSISSHSSLCRSPAGDYPARSFTPTTANQIVILWAPFSGKMCLGLVAMHIMSEVKL